MTHDLHCRTLNSAIVMPRLNLRLTSKELTVLVTRTDTVGLVMTVTLPSIFKVSDAASVIELKIKCCVWYSCSKIQMSGQNSYLVMAPLKV